MYKHRRFRFAAGLLVATALFGTACSESTSPSPFSSSIPQLSMQASGAATGFSVLANAAVSCTGGSISGDVGTFQTTPPGAITLTEGCVVSGAQDIGGSAAVAAYRAFLAQYTALAPRAGDVCPLITGTLAGQTLTPGVYCISAEAKTGVLTLSGGANATWLIKVPAGALTGSSFSVVLAGGAQACNITWWVDAAATMTDSDLKGNVLAGAAITMTRGTFSGNAWAGAAGVGDVTFTGTAVAGCGSSSGGDGNGNDREKCNQGVGNGPEGCDPGNSNHRHGSNDENGGTPGNPGRRGR